MTNQTPDQITAAADQEVTEAEQLLAALEDRVRDGDDTVTPTQVEEARGLRRFAQLRREAAQRKAEAARKVETNTEASRRRDAFLASIADCTPEAIEAAAKRAEDALFELLTLVDRRNAAIQSALPQLASPVCYESDRKISASYEHLTITIDGTVYHPLAGKSIADQAQNKAANRHMYAEQGGQSRA
ncbi:hypothetical protein ACFVVA_28920 [Kitasatospora sp. NPDC058048]|uniref:hypothetical protein n=1 Tax=Kitasatospora sp. NPDC058048 TaxID=3346313 RepID=UPI0036D8F868